MNKLLLCLTLLTLFISAVQARTTPTTPSQEKLISSANYRPVQTSAGSEAAIIKAFESQQSDIQVKGKGRVRKLLPDDNQGSPHQRFIITLASGHTLLIAHNIDLAPKIDSLKVGDTIEFYGEYEWNNKGGVIHWTHHDPDHHHIGGWLKHKGKIYQ